MTSTAHTYPLTINALTVHNIGPIDLIIQPGECVGLTGPSGTGKSLLLRAIADLQPYSGEICFGFPNNQFKGHEWRQQVGLLPAESHWWADMVGDHFTQTNEAWFSQLGFDLSVLHWEVTRCSTGERQRLALLRLLCNNPKALLLDEPTASLDEHNILQVENLLMDYCLKQQTPMLWVSHDSAQLKRIAKYRYLLQNTQLQMLDE